MELHLGFWGFQGLKFACCVAAVECCCSTCCHQIRGEATAVTHVVLLRRLTSPSVSNAPSRHTLGAGGGAGRGRGRGRGDPPSGAKRPMPRWSVADSYVAGRHQCSHIFSLFVSTAQLEHSQGRHVLGRDSKESNGQTCSATCIATEPAASPGQRHPSPVPPAQSTRSSLAGQAASRGMARGRTRRRRRRGAAAPAAATTPSATPRRSRCVKGLVKRHVVRFGRALRRCTCRPSWRSAQQHAPGQC